MKLVPGASVGKGFREPKGGEGVGCRKASEGHFVVGEFVDFAGFADHDEAIELGQEGAIVAYGNHRSFEAVECLFEGL